MCHCWHGGVLLKVFIFYFVIVICLFWEGLNFCFYHKIKCRYMHIALAFSDKILGHLNKAWMFPLEGDAPVFNQTQ